MGGGDENPGLTEEGVRGIWRALISGVQLPPQGRPHPEPGPQAQDTWPRGQAPRTRRGRGKELLGRKCRSVLSLGRGLSIICININIYILLSVGTLGKVCL